MKKGMKIKMFKFKKILSLIITVLLVFTQILSCSQPVEKLGFSIKDIPPPPDYPCGLPSTILLSSSQLHMPGGSVDIGVWGGWYSESVLEIQGVNFTQIVPARIPFGADPFHCISTYTWNGTSNGSPVPSGVYTVKMTYSNDSSGHDPDSFLRAFYNHTENITVTNCSAGQEEVDGTCQDIVQPPPPDLPPTDPSASPLPCQPETPYDSGQISDLGNSFGSTNGSSYGIKMYTSNTKLIHIIESSEQLQKTVDEINILENKIDSLNERSLTSKATEVQSEVSSLNIAKQNYESILSSSTLTLNNLISDVRIKINALTSDPNFTTGYSQKPLTIDDYESNIVLYNLLFQNAIENQPIGKDTYQLFDTGDILTEEYQLLKDLITDYNNGTIPAEDKDYTTNVLKVLTEQVALHAGNVEHIANKLALELKKTDEETLNDYLDFQAELRALFLLYLISNGDIPENSFSSFSTSGLKIQKYDSPGTLGTEDTYNVGGYTLGKRGSALGVQFFTDQRVEDFVDQYIPGNNLNTKVLAETALKSARDFAPQNGKEVAIEQGINALTAGVGGVLFQGLKKAISNHTPALANVAKKSAGWLGGKYNDVKSSVKSYFVKCPKCDAKKLKDCFGISSFSVKAVCDISPDEIRSLTKAADLVKVLDKFKSNVSTLKNLTDTKLGSIPGYGDTIDSIGPTLHGLINKFEDIKTQLNNGTITLDEAKIVFAGQGKDGAIGGLTGTIGEIDTILKIKENPSNSITGLEQTIGGKKLDITYTRPKINPDGSTSLETVFVQVKTGLEGNRLGGAGGAQTKATIEHAINNSAKAEFYIDIPLKTQASNNLNNLLKTIPGAKLGDNVKIIPRGTQKTPYQASLSNTVTKLGAL